MKIIILLLVSGAVFAQTATKIPVEMLAASGAPGCAVILSADGTFRCLPIAIPSPAPMTELVEQSATKVFGDAQSWILPSVPNPVTLKLWRNGIRQKRGLDYTITGSTIIFVMPVDSSILEVVLADYFPLAVAVAPVGVSKLP